MLACDPRAHPPPRSRACARV